MGVYLKMPGTRISSVGGQPPGRSSPVSPWGQGSYSPMGLLVLCYQIFMVRCDRSGHVGVSGKQEEQYHADSKGNIFYSNNHPHLLNRCGSGCSS
jgi:hypothetical protein